jgi:carbamoylphosphate synthase large subunit
LFIVEKPFISDFFKETVRDHQIPVVETTIACQLGLLEGTPTIPEADVIDVITAGGITPLYTTSENALGWIINNLGFSDLIEKISLFKNKTAFRQLTRSLVPDFFFQEICLSDLANSPHPGIDQPLVIKPATGFMSEGVYKVMDPGEWDHVVQEILDSNRDAQELYPKEVVDSSTLIIEECIQGDEFALDVYFDTAGDAVILSILEHVFASRDDVGDRVYTTSKKIIEDNLDEFTRFVNQIGELAGVRVFPAHIELRRTPEGELIPIEINPLRFGGWCTTADLTYHAYNFNPYLYYYHQLTPDWAELLKDKTGKEYSVIILDNSTGIDPDKIESFDYQKLLNDFENPLELREFDFRKYPLFGFLFVETKAENPEELQRILVSDLTEYIKHKET